MNVFSESSPWKVSLSIRGSKFGQFSVANSSKKPASPTLNIQGEKHGPCVVAVAAGGASGPAGGVFCRRGLRRLPEELRRLPWGYRLCKKLHASGSHRDDKDGED